MRWCRSGELWGRWRRSGECGEGGGGLGSVGEEGESWGAGEHVASVTSDRALLSGMRMNKREQ